MINNFSKIKPLLTFDSEYPFYFLEIIKRRKENPEMKKHSTVVRDFYIHGLKEFDELEGKIIETCEANNARAYFRLNVRDYKKIAFQYNKRIAELLITEDYKHIHRIYASVVGEFHNDKRKTWVVDVDKFDNYTDEAFKLLVNRVKHSITKLQEGGKLLVELPTKNGVHLIAEPFRLDHFRKAEPSIEVHKDNPTILYCP